MSIIKISNITKAYDNKIVMQDFSLDIQLNGITVFMGESGCGKTTLLRILSSLEKAQSGVITGVPQKISYMFQEDRLLNWFSAYENIKIVSDEQRAKEYLDYVYLSDECNTPITQLSGGMKRRVALARALAFPSELVILDEPFKGMDEKLKANMIELVKKESRERPFIIVVHETDEADALGGKLVKFSGIPLQVV